MTSTSITSLCSAGSDSFTLAVAYNAPIPDTMQAKITFTNNSPEDTVALASISTLGVQAPFVASTPSSQYVNNTNPVVTVNFGTGQFATWTTQTTNITTGQTLTAAILLRFANNTTESAGLKVGVTPRPRYMQWGPLASLPSTCNSTITISPWMRRFSRNFMPVMRPTRGPLFQQVMAGKRCTSLVRSST